MGDFGSDVLLSGTRLTVIPCILLYKSIDIINWNKTINFMLIISKLKVRLFPYNYSGFFIHII